MANYEERPWQQDKLLTAREIAKLKEAEIDVHKLKNGRSVSKKDLYKDSSGAIYIKLKGGNSPGEFTGLNINDF